MGSQNTAIARQRQTDGLCQRVHRVGRKHTRAGTTARTGTLFNLCQFLVAHRRITTLHHCRDQVGILATPFTSLHRTTRTEHRRDVQTHGCHQHRCHLVAVGDANHSVGLVGIDHIFHAVGDNVTRRQRIEHTIVTHRDAVVDGDGIELCGITAHLLYLFTHNLTDLVEMGMTRNKLGEGVDDGDDRLAELLV